MRALLLLLATLLVLPTLGVAQARVNSRTVFQQAQQARPGSQRAIDLYTRYVQLEPRDAWGHLALAEALAAARKFNEAYGALRRAEQLAPGEEDVEVVRTRIRRAHRKAAPAIKPLSYASRDTDGNVTSTFGLRADLSLSGIARAGVAAARTATTAGDLTAITEQAAVTLGLGSSKLRWNTELGAARVTASTSRSIPVAQSHLRWSSSARSPALDLRLRRAPMISSYSMAESELLLTEARAVVDLPFLAGLKIRGVGQLGLLDAAATAPLVDTRPGGPRAPARSGSTSPAKSQNRRLGMGGALVRPLSSSSEAALHAYRLSYQEPGPGSYFAPEHVDVLELGTYTEIYRFDPLTIAFDAGAGVQRAKPFGEPVGELKPAARIWAMLSAPLGENLEIAAELDAYNSQLSTVTTSSTWSSLAAGLSLRWLVK